MTTVEICTGPAFVWTPDGEMGWTNTTQMVMHLRQVDGVAWGTNGETATPNLPDGSVVTIDCGGVISIQPGPALVGAGVYGLWAAFFLIGTFIFIRWIYKVMSAAAGVHRTIAD